MEKFDPGSLDKRVTFQTPPAGVPDAHGDAEAGTWADALTVFASLRPLSSGESLRAQAVQNEATHRLTVRYRAEIVPTMRVKYGARFFAIVGRPRNIDERGEWLELLVVEGVRVV